MSNNKVLADVKLSSRPPFPYFPEKFTRDEKKTLLKFFTNWDKPVFAIHNLPQEVVGAMFSRYSRTAKSVRRLFLDEFWSSKELGLKEQTANGKYVKALERTQDFYRRVFAQYGDDSVIQMGSVHIAFEFVSQIIGAKSVEDQRVASAYIEKSTRYVDFGSKVGGRYLFMEPVEIMKSGLAKEFVSWNNSLFDAYTKYLPMMVEYLTKKYPIEEQVIQNTKTEKLSSFSKLSDEDRGLLMTAYSRALKAKALDTIRFFLPLTTVTNLGAHFSGQAAELTINKMLVSTFEEARYFGKMAYEELRKVSPNFLQNVDNRFGWVAREYRKDINKRILNIGKRYVKNIRKVAGGGKAATLIDYDHDADIKIASEIIFTGTTGNKPKSEIVKWAKSVKRREGKVWSPALVKIINDAVPPRNTGGRSRRQKLPRAFEHAYVEIEFYTDIGAYKDLQRNRLSSTERQKLTASDIYIPEEYNSEELRPLLTDYLKLARQTTKLFKKLVRNKDTKEAAEYVGIMGNKVRYSVRANLRQWCFFSELRTISGGHPTYRKALQEAVKIINEKLPFTKSIFANVDWIADYGLGRLKAEIRTQEKLSGLRK